MAMSTMTSSIPDPVEALWCCVFQNGSGIDDVMVRIAIQKFQRLDDGDLFGTGCTDFVARRRTAESTGKSGGGLIEIDTRSRLQLLGICHEQAIEKLFRGRVPERGGPLVAH